MVFRVTRTSFLLAALCCLVAVVGWLYLRQPAPWLRPPEAGPAGPLSAREARDRYRSSFHLPPDRRFQRALADVQWIARGTKSKVEARWTGAGWELSVAGESVGTVSDLPSFDELFGTLVAFARRQLGDGGGKRLAGRPEWPGGEFFPRAALPALNRLSAAWSGGDRSIDTAERAAHLLSGLLLQAEDALDVDEPLEVRTLAALAIARALDGESVRSEECLVSYLLGYSAHAARLAQSSPVDRSISTYVLERDKELAELAHRGTANLQTRYLYLMSLTRMGERETWLREVRAWNPDRSERSAVLGTALGAISFETRDVPVLILALSAEDWLQTKPPNEGVPAWTLARAGDVETAIQKSAAQTDGVFADPAVAFAVDGARYLSGLFEAMMFAKNALSSAPAMRSILEAIPETRSGALADLRRWFAVCTDWEEGQDTFERRHALMLDRDFLLGGRERTELLGNSAWVAPAHGGDIAARQLVLEFLPTLDSRPEHRDALAPLVRNRLLNPARADWLETSVVRDNGPEALGTRVAVLARHGGAAALRSEVLSGPATPRALPVALDWLAKANGQNAAAAGSIFAELWTHPELRRFVYYSYADYLREVEDYAGLGRVAREFLADPASQSGLGATKAIAALSYSLRQRRHRAEAWRVIEPELAGQVGDAFAQGVLALIDLDRFGEAESLAKAGLTRYPNDPIWYAAIAKARWRSGRYDEAARAVTRPGADLSNDEFERYVAPFFWYAFEGRPAEQVLEAFDTLVQADAPNGLFPRAASIAAFFEARGQHQLAFELYARVARLNFELARNPKATPLYRPAPETLQVERWRSEHIGSAWRNLRAWKGDDEARRWVLSLKPDGYPWDVAPHLVAAHAYELLWDAYPQKEVGETLWLVRATVVLRDPDMKALHGDEVRRHFAEPKGSSAYMLGRVALGLEPEAKVTEKPLKPRELCELAFYLGVAAQSRGELSQAADWYAVAISTGKFDAPEVNLARQQLDDWRSADVAFEPFKVSQPVTGPVAALY